MKNSSWTGRAPRTLEGAFGCGTSRHITEDKPDSGYSWLWWAAMCAVIIATIFVI